MTKNPYVEHKDRIAALRAAYAAGISPLTATDVSDYLNMTLDEIGQEWDVDPIQLLLALDKQQFQAAK